MRRLLAVILALGFLGLGACASSKPCPAYAKAEIAEEVKG